MPKGVFTFRNERKKLPNGLMHTVQLIDHPGAVLIMPFYSPRKVVLLRQYRPTLDNYLYEFPCGTLDPQESVLRCARRELAEEAGYGARNFRKMGAIHTAPGFTNEKIVLYAAHNLYSQTAVGDPDEIISVQLVSRTQIKMMITRHQITDAKTICALAFAGWLR